MKYLLALLLMASQAYSADRQVSVSGTGSVSITPDIAFIELNVVTSGDTVKTLVKSNSDEMKNVMKVLKETFKVQDADLCTHNFRVEKNYNKEGYSVTNSLMITVRDVSKAGEMLGQITTSDYIRLESLYFTASEELRESVITKAREKAVSDARDKAETYVKAAGAEVDKVITIAEQTSYSPRYEGTARAASAAPVSPGTQKVSVTIAVTFSIK